VEQCDRCGRTLVSLRLPGGRPFNGLLGQGIAVPLTIPPNVRHAKQVRQLARRARDRAVGLWSSGACGGTPAARWVGSSRLGRLTPSASLSLSQSGMRLLCETLIGMVPTRYDRSTAMAWVCEEAGDSTAGEDGCQALALFSAHVESDELPEGFAQGPECSPAEEAIAWARARAAKVIVRCCETWENTFYSAGEKQAFGEEGPLPDWPKGGLGLEPRRLPGWEHLDRTADDEPIQWEVIAGGDVFPQPAEFGPAFENALGRDRSVAVVRIAVSEPHVHGRTFVLTGDTIKAHLRLAARTVEEATALATAACARAALTALNATSTDLADHLRPEWRADAYPTGSKAAQLNARLDQAGELR
jgi:hypothetical protein